MSSGYGDPIYEIELVAKVRTTLEKIYPVLCENVYSYTNSNYYIVYATFMKYGVDLELFRFLNVAKEMHLRKLTQIEDFIWETIIDDMLIVFSKIDNVDLMLTKLEGLIVE